MVTENKKDGKDEKKSKSKNWRKNKLGWKLFVILMGLVVAVFLIGSLVIQGNCNDCNDDDHGHGTVPTATPHVTTTPVVTPCVTPVVTPVVTPTSSLQITGTISWTECMKLLRDAFPNASQRGVEGAPYDVPTLNSLKTFFAGCDLSSEKDTLACFGETNIAVGFAKISDGEFMTITIADGILYKVVGTDLHKVVVETDPAIVSLNANVIYCVLY
jgi:hypothetical protein